VVVVDFFESLNGLIGAFDIVSEREETLIQLSPLPVDLLSLFWEEG